MADETKTIKRAIADTGPLLSALILDYVRNALQARRASILVSSRLSQHLLGDERRQELFIEFFDGIPTIITTAHVIAELQGLQTLRGAYQREFWLGAMSFLRMKKLDERLISLLDMSEKGGLREAVCAMGPTDAGLVELARQEGEGCTLLTDDERTLARHAWDLGIDCRLMKNLIL